MSIAEVTALTQALQALLVFARSEGHSAEVALLLYQVISNGITAVRSGKEASIGDDDSEKRSEWTKSERKTVLRVSRPKASDFKVTGGETEEDDMIASSEAYTGALKSWKIDNAKSADQIVEERLSACEGVIESLLAAKPFATVMVKTAKLALKG